MSSLVYVLHIATLAIWLSLAGLDGAAWLLPVWRAEPKSSRAGETAAILPPPEISLGVPREVATEAAPTPELAALPESLPAPPELPALAEFPPLPDVPDVPDLPVNPSATALKAAPVIPTPKAARRTATPTGRRPASATEGSAGGPAAAARLAAGRMPPPNYPADARRKGQSGTVLVEFMVGTDGRVISAYPRNPSPWPVLDNEAVRTVRGWKFLPGPVMRLQRPIVFQLK
jgi:protein TonB